MKEIARFIHLKVEINFELKRFYTFQNRGVGILLLKFN